MYFFTVTAFPARPPTQALSERISRNFAVKTWSLHCKREKVFHGNGNGMFLFQSDSECEKFPSLLLVGIASRTKNCFPEARRLSAQQYKYRLVHIGIRKTLLKDYYEDNLGKSRTRVHARLTILRIPMPNAKPALRRSID